MSLPRFSVDNPVLVNLFMFTIIGGGAFSALTMVREMFPESRPDAVFITTAYPGATPAEVEKGITLKIEERIKDIEGIEKITSTITEGHSTIVAELESDYDDIDQAVIDAKDAVDSIPREDFPEDALETVVARFEPRFPVISVSLYGNAEERDLKDLGERLRDDLLALPDITNVVLSGTRKDEISVEVRPEKLVQYGLSFLDVADTIARGNLDLPGGQIKTPHSSIAVRTLGEEDQGQALYDLVVRSDPEGRTVRLRDVAHIVDGFEDADVAGRFNTLPAASVTVYKTSDQDAIAIAARVRALVAGKMGEPLTLTRTEELVDRFRGEGSLRRIHDRAASDRYPEGIRVAVHTDLSRFIEGRLDLLERNGLFGLVLVFLSLLVFLHWRVAFWVMMGLMLAIAGSLMCMQWAGQTLNLMSMFGLIIVLGLLVDDAIIVAEHVYSKVEQGVAPHLAAIEGTEEVTWPVICAITTTIAAFLPLMFLEGQLGDWMGVLPIIVCIALSVSLAEALTILPCHLAHGLRPLRHEPKPHHRKGLLALPERIRVMQETHVLRRMRTFYDAMLRRCLAWRYVTIAALTSVLIVCLGVVAGGHVPFVFIQKMDSETVIANIKMGVGAPFSDTLRAAQVVENAAVELPESRSVYSLLGYQLSDSGSVSAPQAHMAQIFIELSESEHRERSSDEVMLSLREQTADIPGVERLRFISMQGGPGGAPIHLEISGNDVPVLTEVSHEVQAALSVFDGVFDIVDDFDAGRREAQIELLDSARALGLTTESLALQVRAAFYGFEARKVQRGKEDVKIMVRYPQEHRRRIYDIEAMWIATPAGGLVPFKEVARLTDGTGFATINRVDQRRTVTVTADVDESVVTAEMVRAKLDEMLPALAAAHPGVQFRWGGQKLELAKSFGSLRHIFVIAVILIFVLLAALFKSYIQPLIVLSVVPFGFIGAVVGHYLMGYPLTMLSMIGLVALTGIVVNDSMILVAFINRRIEAGDSTYAAVLEAGRSRLRPILLTSATTVLGIAPLIFEQSFQARFLIPMGISISAGLIFATVLTLIAVPCLYLILHDVLAAARKAAAPWRGESVAPAT